MWRIQCKCGEIHIKLLWIFNGRIKKRAHKRVHERARALFAQIRFDSIRAIKIQLQQISRRKTLQWIVHCVYMKYMAFGWQKVLKGCSFYCFCYYCCCCCCFFFHFCYDQFVGIRNFDQPPLWPIAVASENDDDVKIALHQPFKCLNRYTRFDSIEIFDNFGFHICNYATSF